MRTIITASRQKLEAARIDHPFGLISFRDPELPSVHAINAVARLDLTLYDSPRDAPNLPGPQREHAVAISNFMVGLPIGLPLIIQCEAGIGRSVAAAAALMRHQGDTRFQELLRTSNYNRRLYQLLCMELKLVVPVEPLVALAVRVKIRSIEQPPSSRR